MITLNAIAQEEIKEGVIKMKMTMSSDNDQVNASLAMMGDLTMNTYFKSGKSRSEMKNPMAGNTTTIVDKDAKKILVLLDNPMMGKKYIERTIDISEEDINKLTITETGDTKTIAGYVCKGYNVSGKKDGQDVKTTIYTTEKITAPTQNTADLGDKVKGFPMYMTMDVVQGGFPMTIVSEVTEVKSEKLEDGKFSMVVPEGYSKMETPKPAGID